MSQTLEEKIMEINETVKAFAKCQDPAVVLGEMVMIECHEHQHVFAWFPGVSACPLCHALGVINCQKEHDDDQIQLITTRFITPVGLLAFQCHCNRVFLVSSWSLLIHSSFAPGLTQCNTLHWDYSAIDAVTGIAVRTICTLFNRVAPQRPSKLYKILSMVPKNYTVTFTTPANFGRGINKYVAAFEGAITDERGHRGLAIVLKGASDAVEKLRKLGVTTVVVNPAKYVELSDDPQKEPSYNTNAFVSHVLSQLKLLGFFRGRELEKTCCLARKELSISTKSLNVWGLTPESFPASPATSD